MSLSTYLNIINNFRKITIVLLVFPIMLSSQESHTKSISDSSSSEFGYGIFEGMHYRIAYPLDYDSTKYYPVTFILHGSGKGGTDNEKQVGMGIFWRSTAEKMNYNEFTIVPQNPINNSLWNIGHLHKFVRSILDSIPADTTRIVCAGWSAGGFATCSLLQRDPSLFMAGIPISGGSYRSSMKQVPLWLHHGAVDENVDISISENIVNEFEKTGLKSIRSYEINDSTLIPLFTSQPKLLFTTYKNWDHNILSMVYGDTNIFRWLSLIKKPVVFPKVMASHNSFYYKTFEPVKFKFDIQNRLSHNIHCSLKIVGGNQSVTEIQLFNDGMHSDSLSGDNIWCAELDSLPSEDRYYIGVVINDTDHECNFYFHDITRITTIGPVKLSHYNIISSDSIIYPGEVINLKLYLENQSTLKSVESIQATLTQIDENIIAGINPYQIIELLNPGDCKPLEESYIIKIDENFNSTIGMLQLDIYEDGFLFWKDTLYLDITTELQDVVRPLLMNFDLKENYPNPFNPSTIIEYDIPTESFVTLKIYDILGREAKTLVKENQKPGTYKIAFNAIGLTSGVYFYKIMAGDFVETKKMLLLR